MINLISQKFTNIAKLYYTFSTPRLNNNNNNSNVPPQPTVSPASRMKVDEIITDPKKYTKLVFNSAGRCKIFEHKRGESDLRWLTRISVMFTVLNTFLTATEYSMPIFGGWNGTSFAICMAMGYGSIVALNTFSKRIVSRIDLHENFKMVDLTFFNAFWKPQTITYHISEFQDPYPSYMGFTKFELTSMGKIWINLDKNEFRTISDYEQILDSIIIGKPLDAHFLKKPRKNNPNL